MEFLQKIIDVIPMEASVVVVIAGALDFIFRLIKTEKPLSIAWLVVGFIKKVGDLFIKLASFLDKVLPQKTKELPKQ